MAAMADSPYPSSITANVLPNGNGTTTVTVSGSLAWDNFSCDDAKGKHAGYNVVWNDPNAAGYELPGTNGVGVAVSTFGQTIDNTVHPATCTSGGSAVFGSISHIYSSASPLPTQVCAVAYHWEDNKAGSTGGHSLVAGGPSRNDDNSVEESPKLKNGDPALMACADLVKPQPDVTPTKTGPNSVTVGDDITWTITVRNASANATDQTVSISDPLPNNVSFKSLTPASGWSCPTPGQSFTCTYANSIPANTTIPAVTVTAKSLSVGTVHNVVTVSTNDDSNPNNNTSSWDTVVNPGKQSPQPDVTITKHATPSVIVGDNITYSLVVSNDSKVDTDKTLTVTDNVPASVQVSQVIPGNGWTCHGTQNVSCTYSNSLAAGADAPAIRVIGTALSSAIPSVTNVADVTNPNDANPNNNEDSAVTVVDTTAPVLNLAKSAVPADGSTVERGDRIDYTLRYANTGNASADNAVITDNVPAHTTYVDGSATCAAGCTASYDTVANQVSFSLNIPADSNGSVTFAVTVDNDVLDGTVIPNVGQLTSGTHKVPSNRVRHLVYVPSGDLQLRKSVDKSEAKVGDTLNYTLVAKATGNMAEYNVVVTDAVPDGTTFQSADCALPCTASQSGGVVTFDLGDMQPGDSQSMTFAVTIDGAAADGTLPTEIPNVGHVKSTETPKTPSNRVVTTITTVLGTKIVKTTPPATTLPFTGLPVLQDILLAMVLIGGGVLLLTWPRLQRNRAVAV